MTILFLTSSPVAYEKLKSEIDEAISKGKISSPIRDTEARQLPYLQAVIKEGVRVFPVVTATFFKRVPKGGDVISGYFVPEGTEVGHNVLGIMRSRKYWGEDADIFRPERWIEADEETFEMMTGVVETLWGAGRYKCLGRAIAQVELNKVFVEVGSPHPHLADSRPIRYPIWCSFYPFSNQVHTIVASALRLRGCYAAAPGGYRELGFLPHVGIEYASYREKINIEPRKCMEYLKEEEELSKVTGLSLVV